MKGYLIWRINPVSRTIAPLRLDKWRKNFALDIQRICKASHLGHMKVCDVDEKPLMLAADARAEEGQPGFRFKGCSPDVTAGIGVLFGMGEKGGLVGVPVNREWVLQHIVWVDAEEADADRPGEPEVIRKGE